MIITPFINPNVILFLNFFIRDYGLTTCEEGINTLPDIPEELGII